MIAATILRVIVLFAVCFGEKKRDIYVCIYTYGAPGKLSRARHKFNQRDVYIYGRCPRIKKRPLRRVLIYLLSSALSTAVSADNFQPAQRNVDQSRLCKSRSRVRVTCVKWSLVSTIPFTGADVPDQYSPSHPLLLSPLETAVFTHPVACSR